MCVPKWGDSHPSICLPDPAAASTTSRKLLPPKLGCSDTAYERQGLAAKCAFCNTQLQAAFLEMQPSATLYGCAEANTTPPPARMAGAAVGQHFFRHPATAGCPLCVPRTALDTDTDTASQSPPPRARAAQVARIYGWSIGNTGSYIDQPREGHPTSSYDLTPLFEFLSWDYKLHVNALDLSRKQASVMAEPQETPTTALAAEVKFPRQVGDAASLICTGGRLRR